jgi:hypothetical protein
MPGSHMLQAPFCLYAAWLFIDIRHAGYSRLFPHWCKGCFGHVWPEAGLFHVSSPRLVRQSLPHWHSMTASLAYGHTGAICCAQKPTRLLRMAQTERSPPDPWKEGGVHHEAAFCAYGSLQRSLPRPQPAPPAGTAPSVGKRRGLPVAI